MTELAVTRECAGDDCRAQFTPRRPDAQYCGGRCRQRAYRLRHEPPKPLRRRPITESWRDATRTLRLAAERVERLMADDRFEANLDALFRIGADNIGQAGQVSGMFFGAWKGHRSLKARRAAGRQLLAVTAKDASDGSAGAA